MLVNNTAIGTNAVIVNSGATLGGSGTIGGAITLQSGGTIAPGARPTGPRGHGFARHDAYLEYRRHPTPCNSEPPPINSHSAARSPEQAAA